MKKLKLLILLSGLLLFIVRVEVFAQTTVEAFVATMAGGSASSSTYDMLATVGEGTPPGSASAGQFTIFGGFIHTLIVSLEITHAPITDGTEGQDINIQVSVTPQSAVAGVKLKYRDGGGSNYTEKNMSDNTGTYGATIPGTDVTARGSEYLIEATDLNGNITKVPITSEFYAIRVSVPEPGVVKSNIPGGSEQTAYRLISVPLDLDKKSPRDVLEDDLGAYDTSEWRFYELGSNQTYSEFPNTSAMTPGKAFWLIVKDSGKQIRTGAGTSNQTSQAYDISLHSGWNFIANPFNFSIPKVNLSLANGNQSNIDDLLFFSGNWSVFNGSLQPFAGYAIWSDASDRLSVDPHPPSASSSLNKIITDSDKHITWSIQILAQCQRARDNNNFAAVAMAASYGWDELDRPEPPVIGEYVSAYFPHPEWDRLSTTYRTDVRPEAADGHIWEFEVKTNIRDQVNLTFEGLDKVPQEFEVWLVDESVNISINLRESNSYFVAGLGEDNPKSLKLVLGKQEFVDEQILESPNIPVAFELSQNFPNPFNPATTIRYGLPTEEIVTLKIYNLLGEEILTLINDEQKSAGFHVTIWNGKNQQGQPVASGIYIYSLRISEFSQTKKMIFMK